MPVNDFDNFHSLKNNEYFDVNNSEQGPQAEVPSCIANHFNWGACILNWIWGIGNNTYITFLILAAGLVPYVGLIISIGMSVWFGMKGNTWAWQNKKFASIEHFHRVQRNWAIFACLIEFLILPLIVIVLALLVLRSNGGYEI